jgi:omega-6 fatty acid desaturase (delta-12 desaturase)
VGIFISLITLTPYHQWRRSHAIHHANAGNLDERFIGDVPTWTVDEYLEKGFWERLTYRLYRFPLVLFVILPLVIFFIVNRFPTASSTRKERKGILWTNVAVALLWASIIAIGGWQAFLFGYVPVMWLATGLGTWLFFVQHQFEDTYWEHQEEWDYTLAGLQGSSYYKLPKVLQWFTGSIGFHHIHHLSPGIPNYKLEKCHNENPIFQNVVPITLRSSIMTIPLSLWDKDQKKLISFRQLRLQQRAAAG